MAGAVFGEGVLGFIDEFLGAGVAEEVGELGEFAFAFGELMAAGGVHQADAGFDAALEAVAAAEVFGVVESEVAGFF